MFRVGLFLLKHHVLISLLFIMKGFSKSFIIRFCFPESKNLKLIKFQSANRFHETKKHGRAFLKDIQTEGKGKQKMLSTTSNLPKIYAKMSLQITMLTGKKNLQTQQREK